MKRILIIGLLFVTALSQAANDKEYIVDVEKKLKDCRELVTQAVEFFKKNKIEDCCQSFVSDMRWRRGEIEIFVFDDDGVCYVFGQNTSIIWKSFQDKKTAADNDFIAEMVKIGRSGGLVNYKWNNSFMESFVQSVLKDGRLYIIGAGFYPASAEYRTEQMVKSAIRFAETNSPKQLFEMISNPFGPFVQGDIYLYIYDFDGNVVAHGESFELVGQNLINMISPNGRYRTRDLIDIAKSNSGSGWYTYVSRQGGAPKKTYVERLVDMNTGKKYAVMSGYYPTIDDNAVQSLVKRAGNELRVDGAERAIPEFSKKNGKYVYGSANIFVYDPKGVSLADSANPAFVGLDLTNTRDAEGKYIVRTILEHADKYPNGGWLGFSLRNSFAMMYVEKIKVPDGDFIIGATYYPSNKYIHVRFMVDRAVGYLANNEKEKAFNAFASNDPDFLRGDVNVFVYSNTGHILVDGQDRNVIWQDNKQIKDDKGRLISDKILAIATSGGGWFEFNKNNARCRIYIKQVIKEGEKNAETFIIGSAYYL
jgi:signal transduction histidine kinase